MPEKFLDCHKVGAVVEEHGGESVPKHVRAHFGGCRDRGYVLVDDAIDEVRVDRVALGSEEQDVRWSSLSELRFSDLKIRKKNGMEGVGEGNYSLLVPFSVNEELVDRQINLIYSEIAEFRDSHASEVESLQYSPVAVPLIIVREELRLEHKVHLVLVKENGQFARGLYALDGPGRVYLKFSSGAKEAVVATESRHLSINRDWRDSGGEEIDHPASDAALGSILDG